MKHALERELKLSPGEGFTLPELGGTPLEARTFVSTYHDTPDHALLRGGITLRYRVEAGTGVWQLKLPSGDARREIEEPGPPARPPADLLGLLAAHLRGREVAPVARLRTRREGVLADGAEVTQDTVSVMDGQRVASRFHELEVELTDGDEASLERLSGRLIAAGAEPAPLRPKILQALGVPEPESEEEAATRGTPPSRAVGLALGRQARLVLRHDPGTRLGADPEELHQQRVATRRLRAFLREARPLLDRAWADELRDELRWLGGALGPARDLDVLLDRVRRELAALEREEDGAPLLAALEAERGVARTAVVDALESPRYLALLDRLDHVGDPETTGAETPLAKLARRAWKRAARALAQLEPSSADAELHEARIRVKRARYATELAAHELGRKAKGFLSAARGLQDVLGEHQDAVVAAGRVSAWADDGGDHVLASLLLAVEKRRREDARSAWPAAAEAFDEAARRLW